MKRKLIVTMKASEFPNSAIMRYWLRYYMQMNVQTALEYFE